MTSISRRRSRIGLSANSLGVLAWLRIAAVSSAASDEDGKCPRAGILTGPRTSQLDRLDLGHEPLRVGREERSHDIKHSITKAADVQDVVPVRGLRGRVGLQINANQTRTREVAAVQSNLVVDELLPFGHHGR